MESTEPTPVHLDKNDGPFPTGPFPTGLPYGPDPLGTTTTLTPAPAAEAPRFRLERSRSDRMVAGVCGGAGRSLGVDPALLRIGLVLLTIFGVGAGVVLYLAAWILAPQEEPI